MMEALTAIALEDHEHVEQKENSREGDADKGHRKVLVEVSRILYILFAGLFYTHVEGWTFLEAAYFAMVTMSTCGYGDFYPTEWYSQMVTVFFILVGISVVFAQLGNCVTSLIEPVFDFTRTVSERLAPAKYIDISGNGVPDFQVPRRPSIYYSKNLAGPILILLAFQLVSAAIFALVEPEIFDFGTAFWYVMVTATTVGYGDVSAETTGGRIWAIVHILISVCLLAALIGDFGKLWEERKSLMERAYHFTRSYDEEVLATLDEDGNKLVGKYEFILGMLKEIGKLDQKEDIAPLEALFTKLTSSQSDQSQGKDTECADETCALNALQQKQAVVAGLTEDSAQQFQAAIDEGDTQEEKLTRKMAAEDFESEAREPFDRKMAAEDFESEDHGLGGWEVLWGHRAPEPAVPGKYQERVLVQNGDYIYAADQVAGAGIAKDGPEQDAALSEEVLSGQASAEVD
ncbi:TPKB [Symbiodinium natans]|uniref:TPKB protein n=1 Tax=Symbiodinium natans TaxID=878477 RepID=A0A812QB17_9DINO|nr:TPKB [Symbiodinium natans]